MSKLNKANKRTPARKKQKIEKKIRQHNNKLKSKTALKSKKKVSVDQLAVPNLSSCKENLLKEAEAIKKQREEERKKLREEAKLKKKEALANQGLQGLVENAEKKQVIHSAQSVPASNDFVDNDHKETNINDDKSLKAYYKEFKKVLDAADVILEIVDARDPLGTRCKQVEEAVLSAKGNKKLVIVLNKADLVPRKNLDAWLKYLRGSYPTVAFKSSTQNQARKLGRRKLGKKSEEMIQGGTCFGAELLLSLLGNYCRNGGLKKSIHVGVVGLPNVGKSSIINSLKRNRACNVGNTPGVTKSMQIVQLDSKVKLLDSPGIVFDHSRKQEEQSNVALRNAIKVETVEDPITPASLILKRISTDQVQELYGIESFSTENEFFSKLAIKTGRYKKGGVADLDAAARNILNDWNSGKIRYYTVPPEQAVCQLSAEIVQENQKEFDISSFANEEKMMLDDLKAASDDNEKSSQRQITMDLDADKLEYKVQKKRKKGGENAESGSRKRKIDPLFEIEGNQQLNKAKKLHFKKMKKDSARREKQAGKLADVLSMFTLNTEDDMKD